MGLLDTIKSLLGLDDSSGERGRRNTSDTSVTVERDTRGEPKTASEDAVKGTSGADTEPEPAAPDMSAGAAAPDDSDATSGAADAGGDVTPEPEEEATEAAGTDQREPSVDEADPSTESAVPTEEQADIQNDVDAAEEAADVATEGDAVEADSSDAEVESGVDAAAEAEPTDDVEAESAAAEAEDAAHGPGAESTGEPDQAGSVPVQDIKGIGPAYAERLTDAGVGTVADLAAADADQLSEAIDVSAKRIGRWIERAKERQS